MEQMGLGRKIYELRVKRNMTQSKLGHIVGVSAQAVSNWECGGIPNAELLPYIAKALDTTIDELFGRQGSKKKDLRDMIAEEVSKTEPQQRMERCFELAWLIVISTYIQQINDENETLFQFDLPYSTTEDFNYVCTNTEFGMAYAYLQKHAHYLFCLPESEQGYIHAIAPLDEYIELFRILSDKEHFQALIYLYSRKNFWFTKSVLKKNVPCKEEKAQEIIECFLNKGWLIQSNLQTEKSMEPTYILQENDALIPFLCAVKDFMCRRDEYKTYIENEQRLFEYKTLFDAENMMRYLRGEKV